MKKKRKASSQITCIKSSLKSNTHAVKQIRATETTAIWWKLIIREPDVDNQRSDLKLGSIFKGCFKIVSDVFEKQHLTRMIWYVDSFVHSSSFIPGR